MDVVRNHCVLVARIATSELVLIVIPLTRPKEVYTVQVSMTENYKKIFFLSSSFAYFCPDMLPISHVAFFNILLLGCFIFLIFSRPLHIPH